MPTLEAPLPMTKPTSKILVEVDVTDIAAAIPRKGFSCPVARALRRQTGKSFILVDASCARIGEIGEPYKRWKPSPELSEMIQIYDAGGEFAPGVYELRAFSV